MGDLHVVSSSTDLSASARPAVADGAADRRRPGRTPISPELVPLLRETTDIDRNSEDSAPIRGIAFSVLLSAPIYAGLYFAVRWVFS